MTGTPPGIRDHGVPYLGRGAIVGRHSAREPNETTVRPDGMGQPWQPPLPGNQQPLPPCFRCGAPFAAHRDGRCPQPPAATTDRAIAEQSGVIMPGAGQPAPWTLPPGAPPPAPRTAALKPGAVDWVRRHRLLTGAIVLVALLLGIGIINEVGKPSGNAVACSDYWSIKDTTNTADQVAGLLALIARRGARLLRFCPISAGHSVGIPASA